jgi:hypothetical protein
MGGILTIDGITRDVEVAIDVSCGKGGGYLLPMPGEIYSRWEVVRQRLGNGGGVSKGRFVGLILAFWPINQTGFITSDQQRNSKTTEPHMHNIFNQNDLYYYSFLSLLNDQLPLLHSNQGRKNMSDYICQQYNACTFHSSISRISCNAI